MGRSSYLTLNLRRYSFPSIHAYLTCAVYHKPLVPSYLPNQLPLLDLRQPALCFRLARYIWSVKDVGRNISIKNAGMGEINTVLWLEDGRRGGWLVLVWMCVLGSGRLHSTRNACVGRGCICIPVNCCIAVFSIINT